MTSMTSAVDMPDMTMARRVPAGSCRRMELMKVPHT